MTYRIDVVREGRWWEIHPVRPDDVSEEQWGRLASQCRRLTQVKVQAADLIGLALQRRVTADEIVIRTVRIGSDGTVDYRCKADTLARDRERINRERTDMTARSRDMAMELYRAGVVMRDIGILMDCSSAWVSQIIQEEFRKK